MIYSETGRNGGVSLTVPHPVPRRGAPASDMWRNARTCARMPEPQPVFGRFGGLLYFDWYKLPPKRFDALKCDFSRKIWKYHFFFVPLQPNK